MIYKTRPATRLQSYSHKKEKKMEDSIPYQKKILEIYNNAI